MIRNSRIWCTSKTKHLPTCNPVIVVSGSIEMQPFHKKHRIAQSSGGENIGKFGQLTKVFHSSIINCNRTLTSKYMG